MPFRQFFKRDNDLVSKKNFFIVSLIEMTTIETIERYKLKILNFSLCS